MDTVVSCIATTRERNDGEGNQMVDIWALVDGSLCNVHAYPLRDGKLLLAGTFAPTMHTEWKCQVRWKADLAYRPSDPDAVVKALREGSGLIDL